MPTKTRANIDDQDSGLKKFELPGSKAHYPPSLPFVTNHMVLSLEADFASKSIECKQRLGLTALKDIERIELDAAELRVNKVSGTFRRKEGLDFRMMDEKLVVKLPRVLKEGGSIELELEYTAKPRRGFYFVGPDKYYRDKDLQAWTQGEAVESKYWFPCQDHPQVKFTCDILVTVPSEFTVISNGVLLEASIARSAKARGDRKKMVYHWSQSNPQPAYLTSVVIGKFAETSESYATASKDGLPLKYYVPENRKADAPRTFEHTRDMLKFFEVYLGTKYPYAKYSQAAVEDFIFGGMENASCTTLTADTLHDKKAHLDFTSDHLVSHELAHQWFGDLVTCRDWQHVWINEGFATYCEALYWEHSKGPEEFSYYMMQIAEDYFEEASSRYLRPIVTKVYKHPDDLFDRHTYEKGACVLHMLRHQVGDKYFRRSLRTFLGRFANGTAETDDLRKVFELESGQSLQQFFDQWFFKMGHPELKVELSPQSSIQGSKKTVTLKVEQTQQGRRDGPTPVVPPAEDLESLFEFRLEIRIKYHGNRQQLFNLPITERKNTIQIPLDCESEEIEWISIDPDFRLLKKISLKMPNQMLISQLHNGITIVERAEAARALRDFSSDATIEALKEAVLKDRYWGVAAEAAKSLGTIRTDSAYEALTGCLEIKHPKARRAVVRAIGEFKRDSVNLLKPMVKDESYFVSSDAATAIGKSKRRDVIPMLKQLSDTTNTFQNIVAQGAIAGLKEFQGDGEISSFLIAKSQYGNHHRVREAATFALSKFVSKTAPQGREVLEQLKKLLTDRWYRVRINACRAFADAEEPDAIPDLTWVAEHDLDQRVRRVAEECINLIRSASKRPREMDKIREDLEKVKSKNLEMMQRMDRMEREMH